MHTVIETVDFEKLWPLYWTEKSMTLLRCSLRKIPMREMWSGVRAGYAKCVGLVPDRANRVVCESFISTAWRMVKYG